MQHRIARLKMAENLYYNKDADRKVSIGIFLLFVAIVIVIGIGEITNKRKIMREGVYDKCTVINSEPHKGGLFVTIRYTYKGRTLQSRFYGALGKSAIGYQYFIKIHSVNPGDFVFLGDQPVPDCLQEVEAPFDGWKSIPPCQTQQ